MRRGRLEGGADVAVEVDVAAEGRVAVERVAVAAPGAVQRRQEIMEQRAAQRRRAVVAHHPF